MASAADASSKRQAPWWRRLGYRSGALMLVLLVTFCSGSNYVRDRNAMAAAEAKRKAEGEQAAAVRARVERQCTTGIADVVAVAQAHAKSGAASAAVEQLKLCEGVMTDPAAIALLKQSAARAAADDAAAAAKARDQAAAAKRVRLAKRAASNALTCAENKSTNALICFMERELREERGLRIAPIYVGGRQQIDRTDFHAMANCASGVLHLKDRRGVSFAGTTDDGDTPQARELRRDMCAVEL